jgi:cellulose biosynthesis protein BcsQ
MTLAIIDTAPHAAPDTMRIVCAINLVAIHVRPIAFDIAAVGTAVDIVKAVGVRAVFVISACPFRSPELEVMVNLHHNLNSHDSYTSRRSYRSKDQIVRRKLPPTSP